MPSRTRGPSSCRRAPALLESRRRAPARAGKRRQPQSLPGRIEFTRRVVRAPLVSGLGMSASDSLVGDIVGGYRVLARLGEGGMATVYRAAREGGPEVALKVLRSDISRSREFVGRFKNYYGPTMNAFEAADKSGRVADLQKQLEDLFKAQNKSSRRDMTSIPATFLRVTVSL